MSVPGQTSRLLVSVSSLAEAEMVMQAGVDILDLKNPHAGALGALALSDIRSIVNATDGRKLVSATIGDVPMQPACIVDRVDDTLSTGVDIVKIGFTDAAERDACIAALGDIARRGAKLVAVLFADAGYDLSVLSMLKTAGFYGVMIDTAVKDGRHLLDHMTLAELRDFVQTARELGLHSGLAGSLRAEHLEMLMPVGADYIGFRGGVCDEFERCNRIIPDKVSALHKMLHKCNTMRL